MILIGSEHDHPEISTFQEPKDEDTRRPKALSPEPPRLTMLALGGPLMS